jgi:transposase InsO family protein
MVDETAVKEKTLPPEGGNGAARRRGSTAPNFNPAQRLLLLDTWLKSGLSATDFAELVGLSAHSLYAWRRRFTESGPEGLETGRPAMRGSQLAEATKRSILLLKKMHPEYGAERISALLERSQGLGASPNAVMRVLKESGYEPEQFRKSEPHEDRIRRFEFAKPNQMWQTDIFTFMLKRQNRRVFLVAFMDDHSRYVVGYGLHASMSTALVAEVFRAAVARYGPPQEVLSDQGPQYHTWRGTSKFRKLMQTYGVEHRMSRPRHPETLGKIERFWGSLWQECLAAAVFLDIEDARRRIGHFIDGYNFHRPHQGIQNSVPADRFFGAADEVKLRLKEQVAENALHLARHGEPRKPFYMVTQVGDVGVSIHSEGERVVLNTADGRREEVRIGGNGDEPPVPAYPPESLTPVGRVPDLEPMEDVGDAPGASPLDGALADLKAGFEQAGTEPEEDTDGAEAERHPETREESEPAEAWHEDDPGERGVEEESGFDPGSIEWPEDYHGSVRNLGDQRDPVLSAGRPGDAGHGVGHGELAERPERAAHRGPVEADGERSGPVGAGAAPDAGAVADGAPQLRRDGAGGKAGNQGAPAPASRQTSGGPSLGEIANDWPDTDADPGASWDEQRESGRIALPHRR